MDFVTSPSAAVGSMEGPIADSGIKRKKRDRSEVFDEAYVKNKRVLQEGFRSLSLAEPAVRPEIPAYGLYEVHNCPSHGLFRPDDIECQACKTSGTPMSTDDTVSESRPLEKRLSVDSTVSASTESEDETPSRAEEREMFISMVKGGKRKYVRKVDYLVDELIRKTRKTCDIPVYASDPDAILPPNVGPSPRTDQAISILVPFSTNFCSLSKAQNNVSMLEYLPKKPPTDGEVQPILLSGEVTHSDWGIQEVGAGCTGVGTSTSLVPYHRRVGDDADFDSDGLIDEGNESDMACYDESSHRYSTNSSLGSGDSGMMVDSDDDMMAGSCRSAAFDESSSALSRFDHGGRHSPWSANTSVKTVFTKSAITDDDEDDEIINVGTF